MKAAVSYSEETLWRSECPGASAVPFVECDDAVSLVIRVPHKVDPRAVRRGIGALTRHHAVLHSTYVAQGDSLLRGATA